MCTKNSSSIAPPMPLSATLIDKKATGPGVETRAGRRKLWDLPESSHCMIIGTCLTLPEVKVVAKRCKYSVAGKSDFQLHQFFVGQASHSKSLIARQCQKLLETKFKVAVRQIRPSRKEDNLLKHWTEHEAAGKIPAALWAIATHPACTSDVLQFLYGEVHMLSHLSGASVHRMAAQLPAAVHEVSTLKDKLGKQRNSTAKKLRTYRNKVMALEQRVIDLQRSAIPDSTGNDDHDSDDAIRIRLHNTSSLLNDANEKLRAAEQLALARLQHIEQLNQDIEKMEQVVSYLIHEAQDDEHPVCGKSLSGKCVLLLGGMPSQCKHFKAFVESNDGRFLHHDGGVETSYAQIDQLVSRADAVFCPVERVSHSAMNRAKKLCKKSEIPLVFLPKSSLSAFVSSVRTIQ